MKFSKNPKKMEILNFSTFSFSTFERQKMAKMERRQNLIVFQLFKKMKWPNLGLFLFIFDDFRHKFYSKDCRLQRDSNSDRWNRRRALDRPHFLTSKSLSSFFWRTTVGGQLTNSFFQFSEANLNSLKPPPVFKFASNNFFNLQF